MKRRKLAETVFTDLLASLSGGRWRPGMTMAPTRQLAQELAVSPLTVMAALRLAARHRLLEVRQRQPTIVLPGAQQRAARLLRTRTTTKRLALLVPERFIPLKRHVELAELIRLVATESAARGIRTTVVKWPLLNQAGFVRTFVTRGFGVAFALGVNSEHLVSLDMLRRHGVPVLVFNRKSPLVDLPTVRIDEHAAAWRIGETLASLGHRNLCLVSSAVSYHMGYLSGEHRRVTGWVEFLRHSGLQRSCSLPVYYAANEMLPDVLDVPFRLRSRPTAIVFGGVGLAALFLRDPRFADLRVPDEISLATFDSFKGRQVATWCPPLTEIVGDMKRVAQCAVELIDSMFGAGSTPLSIRIPMDIHLTGSIGPPRRVSAENTST
ncbi:MAG TPA: LacI family DNA-binding transcriptional regulator [Phycisphaerae bacterium]|nr:LacI family transcriptional regulator [Phycisphaerae bacterium]HOI56439.1 LacI family DNA-binding transcriptional regulator [Phycisphaerae bacterium]